MIYNKVILEREGVLFVADDPDHFIKIQNGLKKREIEQQALTEIIHFVDPFMILERASNGAPIIHQSSFHHISISHSRGMYAVFLAQEHVGVDIQYIHPSLSKNKSYFLNEVEINLFDDILDLGIIWSVKEAMYKKFRGSNESCQDDLTVKVIDHHKYMVFLEYQNCDYKGYFKILKNYILVWI